VMTQLPTISSPNDVIEADDFRTPVFCIMEELKTFYIICFLRLRSSVISFHTVKLRSKRHTCHVKSTSAKLLFLRNHKIRRRETMVCRHQEIRMLEAWSCYEVVHKSIMKTTGPMKSRSVWNTRSILWRGPISFFNGPRCKTTCYSWLVTTGKEKEQSEIGKPEISHSLHRKTVKCAKGIGGTKKLIVKRRSRTTVSKMAVRVSEVS
jgi:hypothetical protein